MSNKKITKSFGWSAQVFLTSLSIGVLICQGVFAESEGVNPERLRDLVSGSRPTVMKARLVFVEKTNHAAVEEPGEDGSLGEWLSYLRKQLRHDRWEVVFDTENKRIKITIEDLRESYPEREKIPEPLGLSRQPYRKQINLFEDKSALAFTSADEPGENGYLSTHKVMSQDLEFYHEWMLSRGIIPEKLLAEERNPEISEVPDENGRTLLEIKGTRVKDDGTTYETVIQADPELDYRFRSIRAYANGELTKESIADDYRTDANGICFPYSYVSRYFDEEGDVVREKSFIFEEVEFGPALSDNDFKIDVPAGTEFREALIASGSKTITIEEDEKIGIKEALELGSGIAAKSP